MSRCCNTSQLVQCNTKLAESDTHAESPWPTVQLKSEVEVSHSIFCTFWTQPLCCTLQIVSFSETNCIYRP